MQTDPFLSPCTKLKSKWVKELYIKPETLKLIEEKVGKSLRHVGRGGKFLNRTPMAYTPKSTTDKWDLIKVQSFCKAKDTVNKTKKNKQQIGKRSLPILNSIDIKNSRTWTPGNQTTLFKNGVQS